MATNILAIGAINSMQNDVLGFSKPLNDGIRIISPETLLLDFKPPYYGDTVNIKFWKGLNIGIGISGGLVNHLVTGYRYIYNHTKKEFLIYDTSGSLISRKLNIRYMSDMEVDFNIIKSHQLEIAIELGDDDITFLVPTNRDSFVVNGSPAAGFHYLPNSIVGNRLCPYGNIGELDSWLRVSYESSLTLIIRVEDAMRGLNLYTYSNRLNAYKNYVIKYNDFKYTDTEEHIIQVHPLNMDFLLSQMTASLYPTLMPIDRIDETQNNRPVYLPWSITNEYDFKYSYIHFDNKDTFILDGFLLSPSW